MARKPAEYETTCPLCGHVFDVGEGEAVVACPACECPIRLVDEESAGPTRVRPLLAWVVGALAPAIIFGGSALVAMEDWGLVAMGSLAALGLAAIGLAVWNGFGLAGWRLAFGLFLITIAVIFLASLAGDSGGPLDTVIDRNETVLLAVAAGVVVIDVAFLLSPKRRERGVLVQRIGVAAIAALGLFLSAAGGLILLLFDL